MNAPWGVRGSIASNGDPKPRRGVSSSLTWRYFYEYETKKL